MIKKNTVEKFTEMKEIDLMCTTIKKKRFICKKKYYSQTPLPHNANPNNSNVMAGNNVHI